MPEDPAELDKALAMYKLMVRPPLAGMSRVAVALDTSPFNKEETDSGCLAFGALLYQYGAQINAGILVALWVAGVSVPRVAEHFEKRKEREQRRLAAGSASGIAQGVQERIEAQEKQAA